MRPTETLGLLRLVSRLRAGARQRPERLRALQDRQLRAAVAHAYEEIPFYRELWDEYGLRPSDVVGVADLRRLPIVTAGVARDAAASGALVSRRVRPSSRPVLYTSGSSGQPTAVACGATDQWLWWAFGMRTALEHGVRRRETTLRFDPHPGLPHPLRRVDVSRTTWVSTALPSRQLLARFVETGPAVIVGTPTSLRQLCEAIEADGVSARRPRAVFAEGEILDAATRETVRSNVGVDPISVYGLTEVGYVAWQCERREGFHLNAEAYVAEVLADGRPAAPGELGSARRHGHARSGQAVAALRHRRPGDRRRWRVCVREVAADHCLHRGPRHRRRARAGRPSRHDPSDRGRPRRRGAPGTVPDSTRKLRIASTSRSPTRPRATPSSHACALCSARSSCTSALGCLRLRPARTRPTSCPRPSRCAWVHRRPQPGNPLLGCTHRDSLDPVDEPVGAAPHDADAVSACLPVHRVRDSELGRTALTGQRGDLDGLHRLGGGDRSSAGLPAGIPGHLPANWPNRGLQAPSARQPRDAP